MLFYFAATRTQSTEIFLARFLKAANFYITSPSKIYLHDTMFVEKLTQKSHILIPVINAGRMPEFSLYVNITDCDYLLCVWGS